MTEIEQLKDDIDAIIDGEYDDSDSYYNSVEEEFFQSEYDDSDNALSLAFYEKNITVKHEANYGGEGEGDQYWSVYSFARGDVKVYLKFDGWYQSYNGSEFTERFWVVPKEVIRIEFYPE